VASAYPSKAPFNPTFPKYKTRLKRLPGVKNQLLCQLFLQGQQGSAALSEVAHSLLESMMKKNSFMTLTPTDDRGCVGRVHVSGYPDVSVRNRRSLLTTIFVFFSWFYDLPLFISPVVRKIVQKHNVFLPHPILQRFSWS